MGFRLPTARHSPRLPALMQIYRRTKLINTGDEYPIYIFNPLFIRGAYPHILRLNGQTTEVFKGQVVEGKAPL